MSVVLWLKYKQICHKVVAFWMLCNSLICSNRKLLFWFSLGDHVIIFPWIITFLWIFSACAHHVCQSFEQNLKLSILKLYQVYVPLLFSCLIFFIRWSNPMEKEQHFDEEDFPNHKKMKFFSKKKVFLCYVCAIWLAGILVSCKWFYTILQIKADFT